LQETGMQCCLKTGQVDTDGDTEIIRLGIMVGLVQVCPGVLCRGSLGKQQPPAKQTRYGYIFYKGFLPE
jgi:hypothetical protein